MIRMANPIAELEDKLLGEIKRGGFKPGERLAAERKLAELYRVPRARVHLAVARLVGKGYLRSRRGSGTFVARTSPAPEAAADLAFPTFIPSHDFEKITVSISVPERGVQGEAWRRVVAAFAERCPYIRVEAMFGPTAAAGGADVVIGSPYDFPRLAGGVVPVVDEKDFSAGALEICLVDGGLAALPILRVPSLALVNASVLARHGKDAGEIQTPSDLLRVGFELEGRGVAMGSRYLGVLFHGALYGLEFRRDGCEVSFDERTIAAFLEETRPYIKRHHFVSHTESGIDKFNAGKYAVYPLFATNLPTVAVPGAEVAPLLLPLRPGGFVCEGIFMGRANAGSANREEAVALLEFMLGAEAQELFVAGLPYCLSVRKDVLERQRRAASPALAGIHPGFDLRSFYTQRDPVIYWDYSKKLNTEAGKYFSGLQGVARTIDNLRYFKNGGGMR